MKDFKFFVFTVALAMMLLLSLGDAFAQSDKYQRPGKKSAETAVPVKAAPASDKTKPEAKSDKVDIQEIENQYWQQKDQDFHVVQNRRYTKEKRYYLSPTAGILINDSFTKGQAFGLSGGYYLSEQNGFEVSYLHYNTDNSKTTDEIFGLNGAPAYNKLNRQITATYNWMPIYGKVSIFDKSIIYFDMGINIGLGLTTYEKQLEAGNQEKSSVTLVADITQQFFIKDSLAIRFDIRNRFYKEEREKYRNSTGTSDDIEHSLSAAIGIVYYFGSSANSDK